MIDHKGKEIVIGGYVLCKSNGIPKFNNDDDTMGIIRKFIESVDGDPMVIVDMIWPSNEDGYQKYIENIQCVSTEEFVLWKLES
jgi:hypothetical protein